MRRLLLALPFALLPQASAHAHDDEHEHAEHASLGAHEHGAGHLNVALDGKILELELENPAMNLLGFEHAAESPADLATVAAARAKLEQPLTLFSLPAAAGCTVTRQELESPLFGDQPDAEHEHEHDEHAKGEAAEHQHEDQHSEIHAHYRFSCTEPAALKTLDLREVFKRFPATHKIQVQLIGPQGQQGVEATAEHATLSF
ncbi:DUF2796 domain-containing protein [Pseudomonas sp. 2FE]|uniref:DUF2796 domain-containing protein n=1 Tax=Pseudomonas sp. 2FE TaxID=2502190 RepID=UPI0010F83CFD|nr:DUF2796 domain-containing protein [Pseudomonas sp. 2FE]